MERNDPMTMSRLKAYRRRAGSETRILEKSETKRLLSPGGL